MSDELDVLKLVAQRLSDADIPYMVSGSMALNYYATPRMTRDIDIVVELEAFDAERFVALFTDDFLCELEPVRAAAQSHGMFNIIHNQLVLKVDFIVRKDSPYRHKEFLRRKPVTIDGTEVFLVTAEDLLLSKLVWAKPTHSALQIGDVEQLVKIRKDLDWDYIEHWAMPLDVGDLLSKIRS